MMSIGVGTVPSYAAVKLTAHATEINACCFSSSSMMLATGSSDATIRLWDTGTGKPKGTLRGVTAEQAVMCVDFQAGLVAGGANDSVVRVWDVATERVRTSLVGHSGKIYGVCLSPDNRQLVSTGTDRSIKVWDLARGVCIRTIQTPSIVNSLDMSMDGALVVTGHQDGGVRLWDLAKGAKVAENKELHTAAVTSTQFSLGARRTSMILTASRDNTLGILDGCSLVPDTPPKLFRAEGFRVPYLWSRARFSPEASLLTAGSGDGSVLVWNAYSNKVAATLREHSVAVSCVDWSPDGRKVASCDVSGTLVIWQ